MASLTTVYYYVTIVIISLLPSIICGSSECPPETYFDHFTDRCERCSVLCDQAEIQGTVQDCRRLCSDYFEGLNPPKVTCPPGQYFDDVISRCDYCSNLCYHHRIQGTSEDCRRKCPNEYYSTTPSTTISPSAVTASTSRVPKSPLPPGAIAGVVVACVLCVLIIAISVLGLTLLCCPTRLPRRLQSRYLGFKRPVPFTEGCASGRSSPENEIEETRCTLYIPDNTAVVTSVQQNQFSSVDLAA